MCETDKELENNISRIISLIKNDELAEGERLPSKLEIAKRIEVDVEEVQTILSVLEYTGIIKKNADEEYLVSGAMEHTLASMLEVMLHLKRFSKNELFNFRLNMDKLVCAILLQEYGDLTDLAERAEAILSVPAFTPDEEREQDKRFHFLLIEETKNHLLISLMKSTSKLFSEMIDSIRDVSDVMMKDRLRRVHINIVEALRSGDREQCDLAIEHHYQVVDEIIQKAKLEEYFGNRTYRHTALNSDVKEIDVMTGLYVKDVFFEKVEAYIEKHPEEELMLWASDIKGLRFVNEKYGMEIGDKVLRIVANKGQKFEGFIFGGRIEGDKFCILRKNTKENLKEINRQLIEHYDSDLPVQNISIKNGIYHIKKNDTLSAHAMYVRAVLALQSIKNSYTSDVAEYDEHMRNELLMSRQVEEDAKDALKNREFCVYLQPKIDVTKNCVAGAEALVRWIHPQLGFMSPGLFIPIFEKNGFMYKLDLWIWEEVCKIIKFWKDQNLPIVPVSVNVSKNSFEDAELADKIIALVDKYGIEHSLLEIEITEYSCLENFDRIQATIKRLHDAGFVISLDDFGTGYSSMVVLSKIEIDVMKLDMSLIQNDNIGEKRNALEFALQLAQMMQFKTVAEGIETEEQVNRIRSLGADYIQGYYYSKPLPEAEFEKYVQGN